MDPVEASRLAGDEAVLAPLPEALLAKGIVADAVARGSCRGRRPGSPPAARPSDFWSARLTASRRPPPQNRLAPGCHL